MQEIEKKTFFINFSVYEFNFYFLLFNLYEINLNSILISDEEYSRFFSK